MSPRAIGTLSLAGYLLALILLCVGLITGCSAVEKLPAGTQLQSSTFGLKISPQALDGTPLAIGSHTVIITTALPPDAGPNLNRFEGTAPGASVRSTVASGPVGEQLQHAGGTQAIDALLQRRSSLEFLKDGTDGKEDGSSAGDQPRIEPF